MKKHLRILWQAYQREVIPRHAPAVQHEECRRAFYAGAATLFSLMTQVGEDAVSEEAGTQFLEEVNQELRAYAQDMARLAQKARR